MTLGRAFDSPDQKRRYVRSLFATIADRYDFITVFLSFGRDRQWKRRLVREARLRPGDAVLDLACGTGDIAFEAARRAFVVGLDIAPRMVEIARAKAAHERSDQPPPPRFLVGDMMALPFMDHCFEVVTTGYGLRNVPSLDQALAEVARVLRPGGRLVSLDFNRPRGRILRGAYLAYLTVVGAAMGWMLHRDPDTYRYIPESVRRYPGAEGVAAQLVSLGYQDVRVIPLFAGFMTLHVANAPLPVPATTQLDDRKGSLANPDGHA